MTPNGDIKHHRAYYHCGSCHQGHFPFDTANHLQDDHLSAGLRPLACLAGTLEAFRNGADDILYRFSGIRLSASTVRRACQKAGAELQQRQRQGDVVVPPAVKPWDFRLEDSDATVAYLGLDAFSVPMQQPGGGKAEGRMMYAAVLYTPDKGGSHYLADFDLDGVAGQMRQAATRLRLGAADKLVALTDGGNGLQEALRRHFSDDLQLILDWYHAGKHLHDYGKCLHAGEAAAAWAEQAKGILYEQGGAKLLEYLRGQEVPADPAVAEELRKLVEYFASNEHRTNYPEYRARGWDIGSGPTEAACKIVGARLKQSGMRWLEAGAAQVAPLRALYQSGAATWDAFWSLAA